MIHHLAQQAAAHFGGGPLQQLGGGFQNEVYACGSWILRLSRQREQAALESELAFIQSLRAGGVPIAAPLRSRHGRYIEELSEAGSPVYALAFQKAPGRPSDAGDRSEWNEALFYTWGSIIGRMHRLAREQRDTYSAYARPVWQPERGSHAAALPYVAAISTQAVKAYETIIQRIAALPRTPDTFGLIHNDLHQGNFFVKNGRLTLFDFDDCAFSWFAQDIAASYYHAIWQGMAAQPENQDFPEQFLTSFCAGYRQEHTLTAELLAQVPLFLKLREGFLYMLFEQHWDTQHLLDWQAYTLKNLRKRITEGTPYTEVEFTRF